MDLSNIESFNEAFLKMLMCKKYSFFIFLIILFVLGLTSCNSYFENRKKPDSPGLSKTEQEILGSYNPNAVVNNTNLKKNIGDIESDLQILILIPDKMVPSNSRIQREEGAHGKIARIEMELFPPYPEKMVAEIRLISRGAIDYAEYPVKVDGRIIRDGKQVGEFHTVLAGAMKGDNISVSTETMFPTKFEIDLWDRAPTEVFSTLLYTRAKLSLYDPLTEPRKILDGDGSVQPLDETEVLGNPLRITLMKGGETK